MQEQKFLLNMKAKFLAGGIHLLIAVFGLFLLHRGAPDAAFVLAIAAVGLLVLLVTTLLGRPGLTITPMSLTLRAKHSWHVQWHEIESMDLKRWQFTWAVVGMPLRLKNGKTLIVPSWGKLSPDLQEALEQAWQGSRTR